MCDYSLEQVKSRPAVQGEKLITHKFGFGTAGFKSVDDNSVSGQETAVCLLPGAELAFEENVEHLWGPNNVPETKVARFTEINQGQTHMHHDALEFPGQVGAAPALLTFLKPGQVATVLQLGRQPVSEPIGQEESPPAPASENVPEDIWA
jgi:hypothetical protein